MGGDNDVPHFDSRGHYQTHETLEQRRLRMRQRVRRSAEDEAGYGGNGGGGPIFNFILVSGILAIGFGVSSLVVGERTPKKKSKEAG